jgi:hypothetical protein
MTYSDRYQSKFAMYTITGPNLHLVANYNTPTINFEYLRGLLLSKGTTRLHDYQKLTNKTKFLDKKLDM